MPTPRMTIATRLVLHAFLEAPGRPRYGTEVAATAGLASGTIHPILVRLEAVGWLRSRWEDVDPRVAGRPARRYYELTPDGIEAAGRELARAAAATAPLGRLGLAGGVAGAVAGAVAGSP